MPKYLRLALLVVAVLAVFTIGASAKVFVIDNMDDATLWTSNGTVTQETANIKEGTGAVKDEAAADLLQIQRKFDTPMDLSAYEDEGVISVWVYVDNIDSFVEKDNQLEFTSSGTCDQQESGITLDTYWFEAAGWNHLLFTMGDFASYDADWSAINFIRAYKFLNTGATNYWIWDDIKIGLESDFGIGKVKVSDTATLIENFDDPAAFTVDAAAAIEGTGAATATGSNPVVIQRIYETPIDISRIKDNGYVYLWLYVENAADIKTEDGQFELTSSGGPDANEISWVIPTTVELKDGWNELLLGPIDPSTDCDLSAVNFMRLYLFSNADNTIKLDKLMVGVGEDFGIMPETEAPTEAPATEAPATTASAAGDTTAAPADNGAAASDTNYTVFIIIGVAAVIVVVVIIIIVANSKKKKK